MTSPAISFRWTKISCRCSTRRRASPSTISASELPGSVGECVRELDGDALDRRGLIQAVHDLPRVVEIRLRVVDVLAQADAREIAVLHAAEDDLRGDLEIERG